ncbi:hypothetical protein PITC_008000 [Penicillium italicum]|uniref:Uncharacterized protein n=1 Tax=Penicillium italicum TaxID=40296 RepID=A0A0A2KD35_PENIT|nr:hypothetical protein PITC_008000 [Penicillium italicum]
MHLSTLLLLSASLASAQFGPGPEELEYLENINGDLTNDPNQYQNQGQNYPHNGNVDYDNYDGDYEDYGNYENYEDHENPIPSPHIPIQAPAPPPPAPLVHSTFTVRPSQAPVAQAQAPAPGYVYNHPSPAASTPFATPVHEAPAPQYPDSAPLYHVPAFGPEDDDVAPGASGGIAPINLLGPDSQVAPPPLFTSSKHGEDEGNTFCVGKCFVDESDAKCAKPYGLGIDIGVNGLEEMG